MAEKITPYYYASNVVVPSPESDLPPSPLKKLQQQQVLVYGGTPVPYEAKKLSWTGKRYSDIWRDFLVLDRDPRLDPRAVAGMLNEALDPLGTLIYRLRQAEERRKNSPPKEIIKFKKKKMKAKLDKAA